MSDSPYHGLRPFHRDETDIFFGREQHADELIERLGRQHFVAVIGYSGCGKSSLVRTGLIPGLQAGFLAGTGTHWRVAEFRPGNSPFAHLAHALSEEEALGGSYRTALSDNRFLTRGSLSLHELLAIKPLPDNAKLLIVCDQFEEIFRYYEQGARAEAVSFIKLLLASCQPYRLADGSASQDVYVVLTMRSDFLGDCALFAGLPERINNGLYLTPRLTRDQLREAIEEPAFVFGGEVAPDLTVKLLEDAEHNPDQLPILQHALMIMWRLAKKRAAEEGKGTRLTVPLYEEIGTLEHALSNHADAVFANDLSAEQQVLAEKMFKALSERGNDQRDTRRPQKLSALLELMQVEPDELIRVIDVFRHARQCFLVPPVGVQLNTDSVIDISHESFIRQWGKLKAWVKEEAEASEKYQRLLDHATRHADRQAALLQSPELEIMQQWSQQFQPTAAWAARYTEEAKKSSSKFFHLAVEFLRRSGQRARLNKALFMFAFLGISALAGLASWEWYVADMHRQRAEVARLEAVQAKDKAQLAEKRAKESQEVAQKEKEQTEGVNKKLSQFAIVTIKSLIKQDEKILASYGDDIFKAGLRDVFLALLDPLIAESESMNDEERLYWRNLLLVMDDSQVKKLVNILFREKRKLFEIEKKYGKKKITLEDIFEYFKDNENMHLALKVAEKIVDEKRIQIEQTEKQPEAMLKNKTAYIRAVGQLLWIKAKLKDNTLPNDIEQVVLLVEEIKATDLSSYLSFQDGLAEFYYKADKMQRAVLIQSESLSFYELAEQKDKIKESWVAAQYGALSWFQLLAEQPQAAIVSAKKGLNIILRKNG